MELHDRVKEFVERTLERWESAGDIRERDA